MKTTTIFCAALLLGAVSAGNVYAASATTDTTVRPMATTPNAAPGGNGASVNTTTNTGASVNGAGASVSSGATVGNTVSPGTNPNCGSSEGNDKADNTTNGNRGSCAGK